MVAFEAGYPCVPQPADRPFSPFFNHARDLGRPEFVDPGLEELRGSIETFKLVGDEALDWNVDDHFLDGLDFLQED